MEKGQFHELTADELREVKGGMPPRIMGNYDGDSLSPNNGGGGGAFAIGVAGSIVGNWIYSHIKKYLP
ncbi:hypothetical protein [Schleiferilactobacillus shenzhenensis]|uniref:hypothetical protein n=1 Tax=Schleiferilactobacillus shenzhenensis TaxID=1231337 RepID=UPI00058D9ED7|nr:hypothetical protein [Schleiferilactobacillus shenzhenensis]